MGRDLRELLQQKYSEEIGKTVMEQRMNSTPGKTEKYRKSLKRFDGLGQS